MGWIVAVIVVIIIAAIFYFALTSGPSQSQIQNSSGNGSTAAKYGGLNITPDQPQTDNAPTSSTDIPSP